MFRLAVGQTPARVWSIVQARTGSTRLPGKVLKPFGPFPTMLDSVMNRVRQVGFPAVLAIPYRDNRLAKLCMDRGWLYVEGPEHDVLGRYLQAAQAVNADHIVRVTADCPFLDVEAARWTVNAHVETGADYTVYEAEGRGVEVFTRDALERSDRDAATPYEREHVTVYMRKLNMVTVKFSVDTLDDLEQARRRVNGCSCD